MMDRILPRRIFVHGPGASICSLAKIAGGFLCMQASCVEGKLPTNWLTVGLFGVAGLLLLGRCVYWQAQQTIASLVSEVTCGSSANPYVEMRHSRVGAQQETQRSELALLQMTLGPRVF